MGDAAPVVQEPAPLLLFLDGFTDLKTQDASHEQIISTEEASGLQTLRHVDSLRRAAACKEALAGECVDTALLERFEDYLRELEQLVQKIESEGVLTSFTSKWTSPMAGKPSHMFKLKSLSCEAAMVCFQYGQALRAIALQTLTTGVAAAVVAAQAAGKAAENSFPAAAAEASTWLRKAAGVFTWLVEKGLPRVALHLPADRPAELIMSMSRVMAQMCLAESQVTVAVRAGQRNISAATVAALHAGAWELWEGAAKTLKDSTGDFNTVSDRLKRYLAASSAISRARAWRWCARDQLESKHQAGQAEAACLQARDLLSRARSVADLDASWRSAVQQEEAYLEQYRAQCARDRVSVYYQTVPSSPPDFPAGKLMGTAIAFSLSPSTPDGSPHSDTPATSLTAQVTVLSSALQNSMSVQ